MDAVLRFARTARVCACTALPLASCAGLDRVDRGNLQPQTVEGPCHVKKFFIVGLSTTPTTMQVTNTGEPCRVTILNADLQIVLDGALITTRPSHGQVAAGLIEGGRSAAIRFCLPARY